MDQLGIFSTPANETHEINELPKFVHLGQEIKHLEFQTGVVPTERFQFFKQVNQGYSEQKIAIFLSLVKLFTCVLVVDHPTVFKLVAWEIPVFPQAESVIEVPGKDGYFIFELLVHVRAYHIGYFY